MKKKAWVIVYNNKHYIEGTISGTKGNAIGLLLSKYKYLTWDKAKKDGHSARKIEFKFI